MFFKRGIAENKFIIISILIFVSLTLIVIAIFNPTITGNTIACTDSDGDSYYLEDCSIEEYGCSSEEALISTSSDEDTIDVYENYIVYQSDLDGSLNIYLYDKSTDTTTQITSNTNINMNPKVYGNRIVYQSRATGNWDIFIYNIDSLNTMRITSNSTNQVSPDITDDWIVWSDVRDGNWNIYGYELATGTETALVTTTGDQSNPRVHGDYLTYVGNQGGSQDVFLYRLSTATTTQITSSSAKENAQDTDGSYVVWQTNEAGHLDIYAYNIFDAETISIATSTTNERIPSVYDSKIIYMDDSSGDFNIKLYDISTATTSQITNEESDQIVPKIWGSSYYWVDERNANKDIFTSTSEDSCDIVTGDCNDEDDSINPGVEETCDDGIDNDCDGEIDDGCEASETTNETTTTEGTNETTTEDTNETTASTEEIISCLYEGIDYSFWADESLSEILNSAADGTSTYMLNYGDGTCGSTTALTFYLYSTYTEDGVTYYTNALEETLEGFIENYPEEGFDLGYTPWTATWPGVDTYYYFIAETSGGQMVAGDTMLVCETEACEGTSITVADIDNYITTATTTEEDTTDYDETYEEEEEEVVEEIDCSSMWDCSSVAWTDCEDGYTYRDLESCTNPDFDLYPECWDDVYLPEYQKTCLVEEEEEETEEVPFFTTINLIMIIP